MSSTDGLDIFLSAAVRREIEQRYYAPVNTAAQLELLVHDPDFLRDPPRHPGLWPDHGIVHVRDVAQEILQVLDITHCVLVPAPSPERFHFMQVFGVMVAYVHDIGMSDFSPFGRAMHPEFATQAVMGGAFDNIFASICAEDSGGIMAYLEKLARQGALQQPPVTVLREMLCLANCHSKSKVPVELLNNPHKLRGRQLHILANNLKELYLEQQSNKIALTNPDDTPTDSFSWLVSDDPLARDLMSDVIDTLRALRAADSLRQRGTVLKTSGNYEIMVDRRTANATWALRLGQDQLLLLEFDDPLAAGEANIASSALERDGSLRIAFQRGAFLEEGAIQRAARNAARVVNDIQRDVSESFFRADALDTLLCSYDMPILLEGTNDNLEFTERVRQELLLLNPGLRNPIRGAARNADIVSKQAVDLLMIPQEVYLRYWYRPYTAEEFRQLFGSHSSPVVSR